MSGSGSGSGSRKRSRSLKGKNPAAPGRKMQKTGMYRVAGNPIMRNPSEKKWFDNNHTDTLNNVTPSVIKISSDIAQGSQPFQRQGYKCFVDKILCKGLIVKDSHTNAGHSGAAVRFMIIQDMQANGSLPVLDDILDPTDDQSGATVGMITRFNNLYNNRRFRTLSDKLIMLNDLSGTQTSFGAQVQMFEVYKRFKEPLELTFNGTTGAVGEMTSNSIFCLAIAYSTAVGGGNWPDINVRWTTRLRFTDS